MSRHPRSVPHSFEDQIAAEKSRLEARAAGLPPGPQKDALLKRIRQPGNSLSFERVAYDPRIAAAAMTVLKLTVIGSGGETPSMILLTFVDEGEALRLAGRIADKTGRTVTVSDVAGRTLDVVRAARPIK